MIYKYNVQRLYIFKKDENPSKHRGGADFLRVKLLLN